VNGRRPDVRSDDPTEKLYAEGLLILQREKAKHDAEKAAAEAAAEAEAGVEADGGSAGETEAANNAATVEQSEPATVR
ncbi:hypothetical protein OJ930_12510, partial [Streptococcus anginosus]|nr:hypothetical protein [Streptococcus anginosus]